MEHISLYDQSLTIQYLELDIPDGDAHAQMGQAVRYLMISR